MFSYDPEDRRKPEIADPWDGDWNARNAAAAQGAPAAAGPAGGAAAGGAAGAAGGAMPWVNAIAGELAKRQQEQDARRQAKADLAAQYASTQGNFPMYGAKATKKSRAIDNAQGGMGIGRFSRGLMGRFRI